MLDPRVKLPSTFYMVVEETPKDREVYIAECSGATLGETMYTSEDQVIKGIADAQIDCPVSVFMWSKAGSSKGLEKTSDVYTALDVTDGIFDKACEAILEESAPRYTDEAPTRAGVFGDCLSDYVSDTLPLSPDTMAASRADYERDRDGGR